MTMQFTATRREFLDTSGWCLRRCCCRNLVQSARHRRIDARLKVAAVFTEFTYRSHAHVILENFLGPYYFNGQVIDPWVRRREFLRRPIPEPGEMSKDVAKEYGIPIYPTIREALCLGGSTLADRACGRTVVSLNRCHAERRPPQLLP